MRVLDILLRLKAMEMIRNQGNWVKDWLGFTSDVLRWAILTNNFCTEKKIVFSRKKNPQTNLCFYIFFF